MRTFFGIWALFIGVIVAVIIGLLVLIQIGSWIEVIFPGVGLYIFALLAITGFFAAFIALSDGN